MVRRNPQPEAEAAEKFDSDDIARIGGNAQQHLLSFVERIERLSEEIKALQDDRKEVFAEVKAHGFDAKTLRTALRRRAVDSDSLREADALLDLYEDAIRRAEKRQIEELEEQG